MIKKKYIQKGEVYIGQDTIFLYLTLSTSKSYQKT